MEEKIKNLNILFFTKGDKKTASSRQRVWGLAGELLKNFGIKYHVIHSIGYNFFSLNPKRFIVWGGVIEKLFNKKYDLFFVHKSHFPLDIVLSIIFVSKIKRVPIIYDLDDAEWIHSWLKTKLLSNYAKSVFCGSKVIKEKIETWSVGVALVPTVVDFDIYKKYTVIHQEKDVLNIGWVGVGPSYVRDGHLSVLMEALKELSREKKIKFVFIGSKSEQFIKDYFEDNYEVKFIEELDWSNPNEVPKTLKEEDIDIGVAPIREDDFSKAKCSFKIIEYMAIGLPVVVSPVGEQSIVVRDGVDGFHARNKGEWMKCLKQLYDVKLREKMGRSGQIRVKENYSYSSILPIVYKEIENAKR